MFARDESRQSPNRRAAHERTFIVKQTLGLESQRALARVADRGQYIADEAVSADALDRRFGEARAKRGIIEPCEFSQLWRAQFITRGQLRFAPLLRELVPWAHRKAVVATIDAIADLLAELKRDRSLVLDGEIGNAAPCIEFVRRGKGFGRAYVEAGVAGAAMIDLGLVARQIERGEDRAEEQP